ncbi:MAG: hypothetical protein Tsb009_17070 [Planctomycetaceae bacterium]
MTPPTTIGTVKFTYAYRYSFGLIYRDSTIKCAIITIDMDTAVDSDEIKIM